MHNGPSYLISALVSLIISFSVTGLFAPWMNMKLSIRSDDRKHYKETVDRIADTIRKIEFIADMLSFGLKTASERNGINTNERVVDEQFISQYAEQVYLLQKYSLQLRYLHLRNKSSAEKSVSSSLLAYKLHLRSTIWEINNGIREVKFEGQQYSIIKWEFDDAAFNADNAGTESLGERIINSLVSMREF